MRPALQRLLTRSPSPLSLPNSSILHPPPSLRTVRHQWQISVWGCSYASVHTKILTDQLSSTADNQTSAPDFSNDVGIPASAAALSTAAPPKPGLDLSQPFRSLKDVDTSDYRAIIAWLDEAQQRYTARNRIMIADVDAPDKRALQEGWNALGNLLARDKSIDVGAVWQSLKAVSNHDRLVLMIEYFSQLERYGPHVATARQQSRNGLVSGFVTGSAQLEAVRRATDLTRNKPARSEVMGAEQSWIAHLLATRWVNLDISISTLHALGVETLGPLSMQAIALREKNAADLARRIDQLRLRGITIGNSAYSRAMASFARRSQQDLLTSLLESDQHPASFDDHVLQRKLIRKNEAEGNWQQAKLLSAVELVGSIDPVAESFNVQLQENAKSHDLLALVKTLETMRMRRIPVEAASIWRILKSVLRPREKGHRPNVLNDTFDMKDTDLAISILKNIMVYGGYVPIKAWTEVTRRLGMVGRLDDLYSVSVGLANAYNPQKLDNDKASLSQNGLPSTVDQLDSSHDFHPLRILFPDVRQRAIIEWSFIHGMDAFASSIRDNLETAQMTPTAQLKNRAIKSTTRGVRFLKQLAQRGVYIKESNVKRAVYERLVIMYGPGVSSKVYNRAMRPYIPLTLPEVVRAVEKAWGGQIWADIEKLELDIKNERDWSVMLPRQEKLQPRIAVIEDARRNSLEEPRDDR